MMSTGPAIVKAATGINGLDEITWGGFPQGRPTLVCGGPGCGKTILAMEFLVRGARQFDEPGLFVSLEESARELVANFASLGFALDELIDSKKLKIERVFISGSEVVEAGAFSLEPLKIRIEQGIKETGARRLVLDTLETLFAAMPDSNVLRMEISRLFHWLRDLGMTTVVTAEKGRQDLTLYGFEEYVSDCVVLLDHRISEQISRRRLRIIKYRGSSHGHDEYPFLLRENGLSVLPLSSLGLTYEVSSERLSTGVKDLDDMFGDKGFYRGSSVVVSGKAGTGKSSLAASFTAAACDRGEKCLYLAFEESPAQICRNMRSIGIDFDKWLDDQILTIQSARPSHCGMEEHLVTIIDTVDRLRPDCVVMDPLSNFLGVGDANEVRAMLTRVLDFLKMRQITLLATVLTPGKGDVSESETKISSLIDTWLTLRQNRGNCCSKREIFVIKSRGMEHSHRTRELVISNNGLSLGKGNINEEECA